MRSLLKAIRMEYPAALRKKAGRDRFLLICFLYDMACLHFLPRGSAAARSGRLPYYPGRKRRPPVVGRHSAGARLPTYGILRHFVLPTRRGRRSASPIQAPIAQSRLPTRRSRSIFPPSRYAGTSTACSSRHSSLWNISPCVAARRSSLSSANTLPPPAPGGGRVFAPE